MRPLKELIKRTEHKPETTILLFRAIHNPKSTVETFYFAPSIKEFFENIFERVATGRGGGFWIQAEYGAGKTHFLATLSCLLTDFSEDLWGLIKNNEIKGYLKRLKDKKLFPIIISLKGEADVQGSDNIYNIIEKYIEESLEERGLLKNVIINSSDELIKWYESRGFKKDIDQFIQNKISSDNYIKNKNYLAQLIQDYCIKEDIRPELSTTTKERFTHIYNQIISQSYTGLLFIIDEFECWQRKHGEETSQHAVDEEILETLAWELPRGNDFEIYTIVASQKTTPTKLLGDRFKNFQLLSDQYDRDYDEIVSFRVRELIVEKQPEIEIYYDYYYKEFKFLKNISKDYFIKIFPFQPRCFQAIRAITQRGLPTARAGIGVLWDTLENSILSRNSLIILSDLMNSEDLLYDLNREEYKNSYKAYQLAIDSLDDFFELDEKGEQELAKQIISTLFLWHIAYLETPRYLSEVDITEATLTTSEIVKGIDETTLILSKIRDLPQLKYTKQKGAIFKVAEKREVEPKRIFTNMKRERNDINQIQKFWEKGLKLSVRETGGQESIFGEFEYDKPKMYKINYRKIEYPGEVILSQNWRSDFGGTLKNDLHFRVVFLTKPEDLNIQEINDPRIAVCIPSELTEGAKEEARNYWTIQDMQDIYKDKVGSEAEDVRTWIYDKKRDIIRNILNKQNSVYKSGKILTAKQIGFDSNKLLAYQGVEGFIRLLVPNLLRTAYSDLIVNSNNFRGTFRPNDAKKVFEGLFKEAGGASISACENFATVLGLSEIGKFNKFNPRENEIFKIIENRYKENQEELPFWKLYNELQNTYGLTKEMVALFSLCFVARGKPTTEITLKPMNNLGMEGNKISLGNISQINWRGKFYESFDTLSKSSEVGWKDVVPYARIINNNIKAANTHEEIQAQESLLFQSLEVIRNKNNTILENLQLLSLKFDEKIDKEKFDMLDRFGKISESQNRTEFHHHSKKDNEPIERFENEYNEYKNLSVVAEKSAELIGMKTYLSDVVLLEQDKLALDKMTIIEQIKLSSFFNNPILIDSLKERFIKFKNSFQQKYQIHHREYYRSMKKIHNELEDFDIKINAVKKLSKILTLSKILEGIEEKYTDLLNKTKLCPAKDPVKIDNNPYCKDCPSRLNLTTLPPDEEVDEFIRSIEKELNKMKRDLSQLLTKKILEEDKGNKLDRLLKTIQASKIDSFITILDDDIIKYTKECIDKANVVTETKPILSKISNKFSFVDDENLNDVVKAFREELVKALKEIKEKNPKKKVKLYLK